MAQSHAGTKVRVSFKVNFFFNFFLVNTAWVWPWQNKAANETLLVKTHCQGFRKSLRSAPASPTYLVMTSFDNLSGNVSASEAKANTHGWLSGAGACGRRRHPAWWLPHEGKLSQGNTCMPPTPCGLWWWHEDIEVGPATSRWLSRVLHEWLFAFPCL